MRGALRVVPFALLVLGAAGALLVGCSTPDAAGPPTPAPPSSTGSSDPQATAARAPGEAGEEEDEPSDAPTGSGTDPAVAEALDCLQGSWTMTSFAVETEDSVLSHGRGGDVEFVFGPDRWRMSDDGDRPVAVSIGRRDAQLSIDGSAEGDLETDEDGLHYEVDEAEGEVEMLLADHTTTHPVPLQHVVGTVVPSGATAVDCGADEATISSRNASVNQVLTLVR
ncbi:hypothetical protein [Desertihabitans aurantiacus]|uniref:hypothetical protein n=1 Tax=Desertihabitans aurantiacus TaxID=2282477 RepID=UPI000DF7DB9A|nr:hypothetical protein [Desertihabitans aurantiacus]